MTMNSIPRHLTICSKDCSNPLAITGSDLLINSIASLSVFESSFKMYRMHNSFSVRNSLKIAGRQESGRRGGVI
jgi:hypothetical protein